MGTICLRVKALLVVVVVGRQAVSLVGKEQTLRLTQGPPDQQSEVKTHLQESSQVKLLRQLFHFSLLQNSLFPILTPPED